MGLDSQPTSSHVYCLLDSGLQLVYQQSGTASCTVFPVGHQVVNFVMTDLTYSDGAGYYEINITAQSSTSGGSN
jgi:hypothetical protein